MKREFLEDLGLEKENIDKVMAEHGKGIEVIKTTLSTKETELADTKKLLEDANKEIEGFKELNVDEIQKKADDYKEKFEAAETKAKEELEKLQFEHKLEGALVGAKAKNIKAVKALLDVEGLKLNKDEIVGLNEQIEKLKEENDYLFESEDSNPQDPPPKFIRPGGGGNPDPVEDLGSALQDYYK